MDKNLAPPLSAKAEVPSRKGAGSTLQSGIDRGDSSHFPQAEAGTRGSAGSLMRKVRHPALSNLITELLRIIVQEGFPCPHGTYCWFSVSYRYEYCMNPRLRV